MAACWVAVFIFMVISPVIPVNAQDVPSDINIGPYVDKVVFRIMQDRDQMFLNLMSGEIDIVQKFVTPAWYQALDENPDISIYSALRNGYGHFTINCGKYPLNLSGFRRAFAYAFDKTRIRIDVLDGFSREHDSLIPYVNDWCIEEQLPYHYYSARPDIGNQILDNLNFDIDPVTGFRTAPDGSPFKVFIDYSPRSEEVAAPSVHIGVDALHSLHVNAEARDTIFDDVMSAANHHRDYDMVFYAYSFETKEPLWLLDYWSVFTNVSYRNPCNFVNSTYDSWCSQFISSMNYTEAFEAVSNMQIILHENVPALVAYENIFNQAYRNDVFVGYVADVTNYIGGPWTLRKIHRIDDTSGGTVTLARDLDFSSFNVLVGCHRCSDMSLLLWPSLYSVGPDLNLVPYLAKNLIMETHADNPSVYEGNTRFTVDIIQNAIWSDGTPITANDVASTFTYLYETARYGNPGSAVLGDLVASYAPTTYRAIIEFSSESMWHLSSFALEYIIPQHIFNDVDGIGYDSWNTWNPVFSHADPYVTSGPFLLTGWEQGEFYELSANPDFCYYPQDRPFSSTETTPSTVTSFNTSLAIAVGAIGAAATILFGGFVLFGLEKH